MPNGNAKLQINWNDIKYLVLLARHGRMSAVAKEAGVDVTTASRRLKTLESVLGTKLFIRIDNRYLPTDPLQRVLARALSAEREIGYFQHELMEQDTALSGRLRVTSVHTFINSYLLPKLTSFNHLYPNIELELIADSDQLDLGRHEADLAIRMGRPVQQSIVTRRLSKLYYSPYAHQTLLAKKQPINDMPWILFEKSFDHLPEAKWQQQHYPNVKASLYCNVGPAMLSAVQNGLGVAYLPCYMAQADENLVALQAPTPLRELWGLVHPEKRHLAKIRAFLDWLTLEIQSDEHLFHGQAPV